MKDAAAITYFRTSGDVEAQRQGLCSATAYFREVMVAFCSKDQSAGKQLADWAKRRAGGGSPHLHVAAVNCAHRDDLQYLTLNHARKLLKPVSTKSNDASTSAYRIKWDHIRYVFFSSLENRVTFEAESSEMNPVSLLNAVTPYMLLAPHKWTPKEKSSTPGRDWEGSCDASRDWLSPVESEGRSTAELTVRQNLAYNMVPQCLVPHQNIISM